MIVSHNPTLVVLSASVAILSYFTTFVILIGFEDYRSGEAKFRMFMAWVTLGTAICATNFSGILAINAELNLVRGLNQFLAAIGVGFLAPAISFYLLGTRGLSNPSRFVPATIILGIGIAATQYLDLFAIAGFQVKLSWFMVIMCVALSFQIAAVSLWLLFRPRGAALTLLGSVLLGLALCANHYVSVASAPALDVDLVMIPRSATAISEQHLAWATAVFVYLICSVFLSVSVIMQYKEDLT